MYEDRTQNNDPEIHKEYIHDTSCHITDRQQFSAVTVSLKSGFFKFKKLKYLEFGFMSFFCKNIGF